MSATLTAEEIDRQMQSATVPYVLSEVADQAKRVPELEALVAQLIAELDRYRRVAAWARAHMEHCTDAADSPRLLAALAATVGMKVE